MRKIIIIFLFLIFVLYTFIKVFKHIKKSPIKKSITNRKDNLIHYRNILSEFDIDNLKSCLIQDENTVNYHKSKQLIDRIMQKQFPEYYWEKMRISCKSSNKIDAAKVHRDIISNNYENSTNLFYTIIIYLQDSEFGYVPYSNNSHDIKQKEKNIKVSKFDILMFDSTSLHRGIFTNTRDGEKRSCIQIFNVVHKTNIEYCKQIKNTVLSNNIVEQLIYSPFFRRFDKGLIFNPIHNGTNKLMLMIEGGSLRTNKNIDKQNLYYMNTDFPRTIKTIRSNFLKLYRFL